MHENQDPKADRLSRLEKSLFQLTDVIQKHQEIVQKRFKVSAVEIDILKLLESEGDKKMKDIGERVRVKLSNLTNIIDRLESQKLVKRNNSKTDRRSIFVHITPKGKKLLVDYGDFPQRTFYKNAAGDARRSVQRFCRWLGKNFPDQPKRLNILQFNSLHSHHA